jgi:hypothetical protein
VIKTISTFLLFVLVLQSQAQQYDIAEIEGDCLGWFNDFRSEDDALKAESADKLENELAAFFQLSENFNHSFDTLSFLGQLTSEDEKLRLITFNYPLTDGTYKYHCILLHRLNESNINVVRLKDQQTDWDRLSFQTLNPDEWYGALYYKILVNRYKKNTYYTLIGWDGNNSRSNRKVVDVLDLSGTQPRFGAPIFEKDGQSQHRLIFEYANDANMALNFQEDEKLIVMDHLAPEHPRLKGQFQFYGPEFSYDAIKFKKGKWIFIEDHNAENRSLNGLKKDQKPGDFKD